MPIISVSEAAVLSALVVDVTLQGFILAVYSFLTPFFNQIVKTRRELLKERNAKFVKQSKNIIPQSTKEEMDDLKAIHKEIQQLRTFPKYLDWGVAIVFSVCTVSAVIPFSILAWAESFGLEIFLPLLASFLGFYFVGMYAIIEVSRTMRHEWKKLEEEKAKAEKSTSEELEKLKKDIEELKQKEAKESLKPNFLLLRFQEESDKPIKSSWSIRILHPDRPIERCSVTYDDVKLPWWDKPEPYYEKFLYAMDGGNVRIPKGIENEDSKVVVRDGQKIIREEIFKDIPIVDKYQGIPNS